MPEIRLNLISREWVIIAKERAKRPDEFIRENNNVAIPEYDEKCPFCPGNEAMTPPAIFTFPKNYKWKIRAFPNKFYALTKEQKLFKEFYGLKRIVSGFGIHYVVVESPKHNDKLCLLNTKKIETLIKCIKKLFIMSSEDSSIKHIIIFKNYGEEAGTSLIHPHLQIIGTPIVPMQIRDRLNAYHHYYEDTGKCLFCDTIEDEIKDRKRIILNTKNFLVFIPYAAFSPFHTWIFPKNHSSSFAKVSNEEIKDLSITLKLLLYKIYKGLNDPSYNMVIRTLMPEEAKLEYFHWYITIIPRVSKAAGFELGSGMFINTSLPEESALYLKKIKA